MKEKPTENGGIIFFLDKVKRQKSKDNRKDPVIRGAKALLGHSSNIYIFSL